MKRSDGEMNKKWVESSEDTRGSRESVRVTADEQQNSRSQLFIICKKK